MKLENQVCSLDLAKRLKELGVKLESLFWWRWFEGTNDFELANSQYLPEDISAFTVAELGERIMTSEDLDLPWYGNGVWFWSTPSGGSFEKTEADARAKMLCYLVESKLMIATAS
jgi:hypothetical protein